MINFQDLRKKGIHEVLRPGRKNSKWFKMFKVMSYVFWDFI